MIGWLDGYWWIIKGNKRILVYDSGMDGYSYMIGEIDEYFDVILIYVKDA